MFYVTVVFVCFVGFVLVNTENGSTYIVFNSNFAKTENKKSITTCDHKYENDPKQLKYYTALEGEIIKINVKHKVFVNNFFCTTIGGTVFKKNVSKKFDGKRITVIFQVEKSMGTIWNCTILTNRDNPTILPVVNYERHHYTATYCYMKIHVRQNKPPQTILVNNMALAARRTDLSNNDVDFTAEYRYADGDVVNVLCANFYNAAPLTMEYAVADKLSDKFNTTNKLSSYKGIGFLTTLHSVHDNTYMICTNTEPTDYTMYKVIFTMQTEFNVVSIKINGMTMRPTLTHPENNDYEIDYKYISDQYITVVCEVNRTDIKLVVTDDDFFRKVSSYKKNEFQKPVKKAEMTFYLMANVEKKKLWCSSDFIEGGSEEKVLIGFTPENSLREQYKVDMEMSANGTVMELYSHDKLKVIFFEFEEGDTLKLNCSIPFTDPQRVLSLKFEGSEISRNNNSAVKTLNLTSKDNNTETACSLIERADESDPSIADKVLYEVRVILRKKVPVLTTVAPTIPQLAETGQSPASAEPTNVSPDTDEQDKTVPLMAMIAGAVVCIIIICITIVIVKLRKRNQSQGPHVRQYENLQTPDFSSISSRPPQCESNYAVPIDRRTDDTTYSVPCQEPALYSVPVPKNQRNKKPKPIEPTYSIIDTQNARGRKNIFKQTDDPNYSEVYADRKEACYAQVVPKSDRKEMAQDYNPYATVMAESPYVNTDPEPMYCEPSTAVTAQGGQYANINNSHYVNTNAQDYVEPTYCEPQKRIK